MPAKPIKISKLPESDGATDAMLVPIVQDNGNYKITGLALRDFFGSGALAVSVDTNGDGITDDRPAIMVTLAAVEAAGGGVVRLVSGKVYRSNGEIVLPAGVSLDMNAAKIVAYLSGGAESAVVLQSNCNLEYGHIKVVSLGTPGTSAGIHCPVRIGPASYYDAADPNLPSAPSPNEGVYNWAIRNMILESNKFISYVDPQGVTQSVGCNAISILGGANNGLIENISIPDSPHLFNVIGMDWGLVGEVGSLYSSGLARSEATGVDPATGANYTNVKNMELNKTAYNAGTGYTTHPHNIHIRNIKAGRLTAPFIGIDTGSGCVRLSGAFNITVENVSVESITYRGYNHTAGDLGFVFAPADVRPLACRNIIYRNCSIGLVDTKGVAVWTDTFADNVIASGYDWQANGLPNPKHDSNIRFESITAKGNGTSNVSFGARVIQQHGGSLVDCDFSGLGTGINVDEEVKGFVIERPHCHFNRRDGILVEHATFPPEDVVVIDAYCHDNGYVGGPSNVGVFFGASKRGKLVRGRYGRVGDTVQPAAYRINAAALDMTVDDPEIISGAGSIENLRTRVRSRTPVTVPQAGRSLFQSAVAYSHTGSTVETTVHSVTVPGGVMGANGQLLIDIIMSATANANSKIMRLKANGALFGVITINADSSSQGIIRLANRNSTNTQASMVVGTGFTSGSGVFNPAVDTSVDWTLSFMLENAVATDVSALESYLIQVFPKA